MAAGMGVAVGDVDGDGKNEAVLIGDRIVLIHRYGPQGFEKVAEGLTTFSEVLRAAKA